MPKTPVSVTLEQDNLLWLRGRARAGGANLSETIDHLISQARLSGQMPADSIRSVIGTVDIASSDPALERADAEILGLFETSINAGPPLVEPNRRNRGRARARVRRDGRQRRG